MVWLINIVLSMYVRSGVFPSVFRWKTLLNQVVFESTKLTQYNRLCDRYSLDLVRRVCNDKDVSQIWFSRSTPTVAKTCQTIMCMFSELARDYKQLCVLCGYLCSNKVNHRLCFCNKLTAKRENRTEQNRNFILFWLGQYVHHLHNHNIYITRSRYQTNMYMYKRYIIVYVQLVDLCSTNTRNKKVSIQKLRMKNILIKQCCAYTHSMKYKL